MVREGWKVNHKRVQRLWCEEGLQHPSPPQIEAGPADRRFALRPHRAEHRHQVWAMDIRFDTTTAYIGPGSPWENGLALPSCCMTTTAHSHSDGPIMGVMSGSTRPLHALYTPTTAVATASMGRFCGLGTRRAS